MLNFHESGSSKLAKDFELRLLENKIAMFNLYVRVANASMTSVACEIDVSEFFDFRT